ncbi:hypothetical protein [Pseudomonas sp. LRF_L74]|uniref:hypothetical protein n=1 Tax=Pseudomonas sp. LRF_L74 TaxID=3369422 RepID=UPI003F644BD6
MWIVALGVAVLILVLSGMFASAVLVGLALQESHDFSDMEPLRATPARTFK